jgi:hypothetical protein
MARSEAVTRSPHPRQAAAGAQSESPASLVTEPLNSRLSDQAKCRPAPVTDGNLTGGRARSRVGPVLRLVTVPATVTAQGRDWYWSQSRVGGSEPRYGTVGFRRVRVKLTLRIFCHSPAW